MLALAETSLGIEAKYQRLNTVCNMKIVLLPRLTAFLGDIDKSGRSQLVASELSTLMQWPLKMKIRQITAYPVQ